MKLILKYKGGKGSGNKGHSGRPGLVGGSSSDKGDGKGIDSVAFKKWFKNSKVVDETGKPLQVYHGTRAKTQIGAFDLSLVGTATDKGWAGKGIYFTSDPSAADAYAWNGSIYPVYLSIQNPFDFNEKNFAKVLKSHGGPAGFTRWAKAHGYDGAKLWSQWVVFDPIQIKSVFNIGTFDPNDPNISKQSSGGGVVV